MKRAGLIAIAARGGQPAARRRICCRSTTSTGRPTSLSCASARFSRHLPDDAGPAVQLTAAPAERGRVSGRPMQACHPQNEYDPGATTQTRTFAFMPNSAAGTLSAVDADHWKLIDLNVDTSGYGTAPLGQLPEQISASDDGCRLISANRGSCDLTLVDPSVLVASTFQQETGGAVMPPSPRTASQKFRPIKGDGTLLTAPPYEAVFLPQDTSSLLAAAAHGAQRAAPAAATPDVRRQRGGRSGRLAGPGSAGPKSWYVLVTYPSCDLDHVGRASERPDRELGLRAGDDLMPRAGKSVTLVDAGTSPVCSSATCAGQALPPSSGVTADAGLRSDAAGTVDAHGAVASPRPACPTGRRPSPTPEVARAARQVRPARAEPRVPAGPPARPELRAPMRGPPADRRAGRPWGTSTPTTPTSDRGRSARAGSRSSPTEAGPTSRWRMRRSSSRSG